MLFRKAAANIARMEPTKSFDPYYKWLGIPLKDQPPTHYRLLGLEEFENDSDVVESAAERQMAHLRRMQIGPHGALSQQLLNEVAAARRCLLDPALKDSYDESLRAARQPANSTATGDVISIEPAVAAEAAASLERSPASSPSGWEAASTVEETDDDWSTARPLWREPMVISAAVGGLGVGAVVVAVILFSSAPKEAEDGRKIVSAAGNDAREPPKALPDRRGSETSVIRSTDSASAEFQLRRESTPHMERIDAAAPGLPAAAAPTVTSTPVALESPAGLPPAGAAVIPTPALPEQTQPENAQRFQFTAIGEPIDLLKRVVLARDAVRGDWRFDGAALVSPEKVHWARLQLLADVPAEYIFTVEILRPAQIDNVSLGLVAGGSQFMYCAKAFGKGGLFLLDGKEWHVNETSYPAGDVFRAGPNAIVCIVHKNGIIARINDRTLIDWEGDFRRLSLQPYWRMPSAQTLFLGTDPRYQFTKVELQVIRTH